MDGYALPPLAVYLRRNTTGYAAQTRAMRQSLGSTGREGDGCKPRTPRGRLQRPTSTFFSCSRRLSPGNISAAIQTTGGTGSARGLRRIKQLAPPRTGGCSFFEDPRCDARTAQPVWLDAPPLVCLIPDAKERAPRFSLWRIVGSKALFHDGRQLLLIGMATWQAVRVALALSLGDDVAFAYEIPAGESIAEYARVLEPVTAMLGALQRPPLAAVRPSRSALVHMRALQIFDAIAAGASHRDIAIVLHGESDVALRWEPDGDLRAQVRYLVKRGKALVRGDYRELVKSRRSDAGGKRPAPTDSP